MLLFCNVLICKLLLGEHKRQAPANSDKFLLVFVLHETKLLYKSSYVVYQKKK